jgi:sarcosine oxidase, subunit alpha
VRRLAEGGRIDRSTTLAVTWDGREIEAHPGDTLASALLAAGVSEVARSTVHDRPRGIVLAGAEEPCGYVQVEAPRNEPLVAATLIEAVDGLVATPLAGFGRLAGDDLERHDRRHHHCDMLVVGGGAAGAAEARRAAEAGLRVVWAERDAVPLPELGDDALCLSRTTAVGSYDDNLVMLVQRLSPTRRRMWQVRARDVVLATGAYERPLVFAGNDLPGVMLAGAARCYLDRFALLPERAVVFTTNDVGTETATALRTAGAAVTLVDARAGHAVVAAEGEGRLQTVLVAPIESPDDAERVECDLLAVSGGFEPVLDLHRHRRGDVRWDAQRTCFVPAGVVRNQRIVGSATGEGLPTVAALWQVPGGDERHAYVDLQRDVTVADLRRAVGAGLESIEHVKRYTLVGTGVDQGRTAKTNATAIAAGLLGRDIADVGTSTTRPPVEPVSFAVLAGRARGPRFDPVRTTPMHTWHVDHGAVFEDVGQWKRPWYYPQRGEDMDAAVLRECAAARESVAMMDASTLGKIDIQGPDSAEFLNRLYTNSYDTLKVGRCRYGLMCRADGMVFDDGVVTRVAEDRFFATTTTGGAAAVLDWMEEWLQTEWPGLRVHLTSVTEQWQTVAVVGPRSRALLGSVFGAIDFSREAFPFMTFRDTSFDETYAARVSRVSFSGELAYEVSVPGDAGGLLWLGLWEAGQPHGVTAYGTETMHVLRAEKGFVIVGQDTDGTVTPIDLGMDWIVSKTKPFVGSRSLTRPDTARPDRKQLVGVLPDDPAVRLDEGAQLVLDPGQTPPVTMIGHVTSSYRSAALGRTFALALVRSGRNRLGETVYVPGPDGVTAARLVEPVFYDAEGLRRDG